MQTDTFWEESVLTVPVGAPELLEIPVLAEEAVVVSTQEPNIYRRQIPGLRDI